METYPDRFGLPLRVQGELVRGGASVAACGSTPACAGRTDRFLGAFLGWAVYPCVCKANSLCDDHSAEDPGLPLRVQGGPAGPPVSSVCAGSTPACAGRTPNCCSKKRSRSVYPCVCRANPWRIRFLLWDHGLPLRVQGERSLSPRTARGLGFTPACAGRTVKRRVYQSRTTVYPCVCRANPVWVMMIIREWRFHWLLGGIIVLARFVPACTGLTRGGSRLGIRAMVYPCGCRANAVLHVCNLDGIGLSLGGGC